MASQLTSIIIPEVYQTYQAVNSPEKTAFFESGIVIRNALLDAKAGSGGDQINIPFWNDLDSTIEANISNTNPSSTATPNLVTASKQVGQMAYLNQAFTAADLLSELSGSSPNQQIRDRFGAYWQRQFQRRLIATSNGILADNIANDDEDMVIDVASESISGQSASTRFNRDVFAESVFTMGDNFDQVTAIAVHSRVMAQMVKNDDIEFIPDSQGNINVPTYMGKRVIVDDGMTVIPGTTDGFKYVTVIFGAGAFGYGEALPVNAVEVERQALQGNGGGVEYIVERKNWLLHPFGFSVAAQGAAEGGTMTLTELAQAAKWDRVVERKNCPISFVITN